MVLPKTTLELDSVFTEQDIANRNIVMAQCTACFEYSRWDREHKIFKCSFCSNSQYVPNSGVSIRTYNPKLHNKKKAPKTKRTA